MDAQPTGSPEGISESAARAVDFDHAARLPARLALQQRFHRLHDGDGVAVGADVVVIERSHRRQARPLMHPALVLNPAICPPLDALAKSIQPVYSSAGSDRRTQIWSELVG